MRIIPAIDLKDGHCVRLLKGDFDQQTVYSTNPAEIGDRFERLQVGDLHLVDLDGAKTGAALNQELVAAIANSSNLSVQLGGGIRSADDVETWLANGVSRCVVGSIAINAPETVMAWMDAFGADAIVLALDVRIADDGTPLLTTHGWTETTDRSLWDIVDRYAQHGARHVLCTDVSKDGAMVGPNFALYREFVERYPDLQLQASGGVRHIGDLIELRQMGVPAAITGRALLDGSITETEISAFQQNA